MIRQQYRCKACGKYLYYRSDKQWLPSYCLTKHQKSTIVRVNNPPREHVQ